VVSAEAAANARPDDPRVVCPAGTTQRQDEGFGIRMVWCVDAENRHHGPMRKWWSNGRLAAEMSYVHGDLDGSYSEWHENGQLAVQGGFRSGLPDGKATVWHSNGRKAKESSWREGVQVGVERRWDMKGRPVPVVRE
jgi:hypothetical protein